MPPVPEIRTDFEVDDHAVSQLHALAFGGGFRGVLPWNDRLRQHSVTWVGAFDQDIIVGFVHVVWDGGLHGFLLDTVVHPAHQRQGVGRAMVQAAVEKAREAGCEWIHVDYEPQWESFYAACGFAPTRAGLRRLA